MRKIVEELAVTSVPRGGTHQSLAEATLKSFNTWAYKREQPSATTAMLQSIERRIRLGLRVGFVLYWGKGPRTSIAEPDRQCLDYLASMGRRIEAVYAEGAEFTLCLTDTHARLNGHDEQAIDSYFEAITRAAHGLGMSTVRLGALVEALPTALPVTAGCAGGDAPAGAILDKLGVCAAKWYRGSGDPQEGARQYLAMNMVERLAVETAFPDDVFITFNGSAYRALFPSGLPIFYMYSLRRGTSVKPWFLDADGQPFPDASAATLE